MSEIKKDMMFGELLQKFPKAAPILGEFGLHCVGCHIGISETIEQGAKAHGLGEDQIEKLMTTLNEQAV